MSKPNSANNMKKDIILAGVGGQGILTIANVLGIAALDQGLYLKQAEVHGMSQRGGDVQSNLRISSDPIHSDLIAKGSADMIISMEPMEALRYLPFLAPDGRIISNSVPFVNIDNYPAEEAVAAQFEKFGARALLINADEIARTCGSPRSANIVLLGAASPYLEIDTEIIKQALIAHFSPKGDKIVDANLEAYRAGANCSLLAD